MSHYILSIDQGTTSSRAIVFDKQARQVAVGQYEIDQLYPRNGWVEHNPEQIWVTTLNSCRDALKNAGIEASQLAAIGISNQRETTVLWDRKSGEAVYNAIVWQDRRTARYCDELKAKNLEAKVQQKTGLILDPYFSATKLRWILDQVPGARERAELGELAFGTIDCYLLWKLTGGKSHCTDATNASRTLLYNIHQHKWDEELLKLFEIPAAVLPEVLDCAANFGESLGDLLGDSVNICGMAGDQQAAAFGQGCFSEGLSKSTYGTGCFLLLNTGEKPVLSHNRLLTTVAYQLEGRSYYAIEGSNFMAGATMQWIRDGLQLISDSAESEALARQTDDDLSVYLVPAFTGLGAPYWDPDARAAIFGLTRDSGIKEVVTAALLSVCYQTRDLVEAIRADGASLNCLRVDGGMTSNDFLLERLADILDCPVDRPKVTETTALGAAYLAGLYQGIFKSTEEIGRHWQLDRRFTSSKDDSWRTKRYNGWLDAVKRTLVKQN